MVNTSDIITISAFSLIAIAAVLFILGLGNGDNTNPISGEPTYTVDGEFIITGNSEGANIKQDTFQYTTRESLTSFSFISPDSNFAFTGAENLDVTVKLVQKGRIVDRYTENIEKLPLGEEDTIDFKFGRKPAGTYTVEGTIDFECTLITYGCTNSDSFQQQITVPKGGAN